MKINPNTLKHYHVNFISLHPILGDYKRIMSYKNSRNSREDKSLKNKRFEGGSKKEQPEKFNSGKKKVFGEGQEKPFRSRSTSPDDRKKSDSSFEKRSDDRPFEKKPLEGRSGGRKRISGGSFEKKSFEGREDRRSSGGSFEKKSFEGREGRRPSGGSFEKKSFEGREDRRSSGGSFEKKPFEGRSGRRNTEGSFEKKPFGDKKFGDRKFGDKKAHDRPYEKKFRDGERKPFDRNENREWTHEERLAPTTRPRQNSPASSGSNKESDLIRLNRYIANAGICSRRKADELIEAGVVSVNGEVVSELGFKVNPAKDVIRYNGETLKREKMVYVLLNKPKDYITTTDDPQERRTVMQLVEKASRERIYPVGRLDRNTTGLLLMTNDGDLAEKLSHPRNSVTKIYHVELSRNLTQGDFNKIEFGVELEDGVIKPDNVSYVQGASKREVGIQIHSGKNRIVRRLFEHLGYEVVKLDRVVYANLTKKDLPRGRWRFLEDKEIIQLKHLIK